MNESGIKNGFKQNWVLLIILPLIVVTCFWIWYTRLDITREVVVYSDTPEWHLYDYDFDEVFVRARGSVAEYVPNALLTPEEFEQADYIVGEPKNSADYLTSRFRLHVPDDRVYALTTHSVDFADKIYINGQFYQEIGHPASTREEMVARTREQYYTVVPQNGVIEIVQQVSNFMMDDGGNPTGFRIGSIDIVNLHYDRRGNMTAMEVGAFLLMTFAYLILFLFQRSYKANLYFALASLVWFFQTFAEGYKLLGHIYPSVTWDVTFRIEYAAVPLTAMLLMLGLNEMFKGLVHKPVKIVGIIVCSAIALYDVFADTLTMSYAKDLLYNTVYVLLIYLLLRFIWRFIRKDRSTEAVILVCALAVYAYATVRDHLFRYQIDTFPNVSTAISDFALLMFTLFIMTASFYATMREVRQAREREQKIAAEKEAMEQVHTMKQQLMANLTHEMRTPLTVMSTYAQLAVRELKKEKFDSRTTEDLDTISQEAGRLSEMASDVLAAFRSQTANTGVAAISLEQIIEQTVRLYLPVAKKQGNIIETRLPEGLPMAAGNPDGCTQVMWNLLANANAHTENGVISISAEEKDGQIIVMVKDTGSGIAPALLPHVLERGVSGGEGGAGLGLAIVNDIMQGCGGSIVAQSREGEGTVITLTFRVYKGAEDG